MRSLVIDDEADARARLIRLLGAHPEVVVIGEAQDGLEAIEKIEELRPDLLFLDVEMPGLTGFEVLRSVPSAIEIPLVIFTTGTTSTPSRPSRPTRLPIFSNPSNRSGCRLR
jgi:two-component system LytT family response regulator